MTTPEGGEGRDGAGDIASTLFLKSVYPFTSQKMPFHSQNCPFLFSRIALLLPAGGEGAVLYSAPRLPQLYRESKVSLNQKYIALFNISDPALFL